MRTALFSQAYAPQAFEHLQFARGGWKKGQPRPFTESLDQNEINDIKFILEKLSKESWIKLLKLKKELKKRGDNVDHVHPLSFFIGVLSPSCRSLFQDLKRRGGMPYEEFVKGAVESFHDERKHGNITDHQIVLFAQQTGKNVQDIRHYAHSNNWAGFVKSL